MRILYIASENNMYSGAFLSMTAMVDLMQRQYGVKALVVLPYKGDGTQLLQEHGIEYRVIRSCNWVERIINEGKPKYFLKKNAEILFNLIPTIRIGLLCRRFAPDLIHTNSTYSYVGSLAGILFGYPVIWHLRDYLEEDQGNKLWYRKSGYRLISRADRVVVISRALCAKYSRFVNPERLRIIYNGVDPGQFAVERQILFHSQVIRFVCVGGLYPHKGQEILVEAAGLLKERGIRNFHIDLVGEGDCRAHLEQLTNSRGLSNEITFCGFHRDPAPFYAQADVAVVPSVSEAFGRVTIEAMMAGLLVIGADSGATTELIDGDRYGVLFRSRDSEDLAEKMSDVLRQPEAYAGRARDAQSRALREFTAQENAGKIYSLYQELLSEKN